MQLKKAAQSPLKEATALEKLSAALSACLPTAFEKNLKTLYVARTHRQHDRVIEELKNISRKQSVSGLSVRGRHEMCLNRFVRDNAQDARAVMEICELLKTKNRCPYYRNIQEKKNQYSQVQQRIVSQPNSASEILRACKNKGFCPYELTKACLADVNVIALSYLYIFEPTIRNAFLKNLDSPLSKTILIIDEAHNLPETAVGIASSSLTLFAVKQAQAEAREFKYRDIETFAKTIHNEIVTMAKRIQKETRIAPETLVELAQEKRHHRQPPEILRISMHNWKHH